MKAKHPDLDKQRDTPMYLERYNCEGIINIEIFSNLNLIHIKYSSKKSLNYAKNLERF